MKLAKRISIFICILLIIFFLARVIKVQDIVLKKLYPIQYEEYVEKYSNQYNVNKFLIYAIIKAESNFNKDAISSSGAKGLMQIMDSTAKDIMGNLENENSKEFDLFDEETNIMYGINYFSDLLNEYKNYELALAAYNAGTGNVKKWIDKGIIEADGSNIENIPFKETNMYIRKIMQNYKVYEELYK